VTRKLYVRAVECQATEVCGSCLSWRA
jgi:hypothetical protein